MTEATNGAKEFFGEVRLEALLSSRKSWTAENAVLTITDAVVATETKREADRDPEHG